MVVHHLFVVAALVFSTAERLASGVGNDLAGFVAASTIPGEQRAE
jgi:hypothetical protein